MTRDFDVTVKAGRGEVSLAPQPTMDAALAALAGYLKSWLRDGKTDGLDLVSIEVVRRNA